ncbi:hypothetical protein MK079_00900, partial [Candidatus Gracilibacteria bacterium]|nr:hypothetical protein [Candidatus Gracilibacteria bacterium]
MNKQKYLINGFGKLFQPLKKHLGYDVEVLLPQSRRFDIITNFLKFFVYSISGKTKKYQVIHINAWENFLNFWNRKGKIIIGESHGFHFGINFSDTLQHFHGGKKILASIVNTFVQPLLEY